MASIRGHQAYFKVMQDGLEVLIDTVTNFTVNMDSSMTRSFYVGSAVGEGDQSIEGWSGSFDMEIKDDVVEKFFDALITNNLNGIGVSDYSLIATEVYPDGSRSDYLYSDMQFSFSKTTAGLSDKVTKSVTFQASLRLKV